MKRNISSRKRKENQEDKNIKERKQHAWNFVMAGCGQAGMILTPWIERTESGETARMKLVPTMAGTLKQSKESFDVKIKVETERQAALKKVKVKKEVTKKDEGV